MGQNASISTIDHGGYPPVLDADLLGKLLRKTVSSIHADRCRAPHRLPPACTPPDTKKPLWLLGDVLFWLAGHREQPAKAAQDAAPTRRPTPIPDPAAPKRGAPSKVEQHEAQRLGLSVRELRAQRALELGEGGVA